MSKIVVVNAGSRKTSMPSDKKTRSSVVPGRVNSSHSSNESYDFFRAIKSNTKGQEVLFVPCDNAIAFV